MKKVIALIVVLALAGGGYFFIKHRDDSDSKPVHASIDTVLPTNITGQDTNSVATDVVKISDFAFTPANITVKKGTTVTWTNQDPVTHRIIESAGRGGPQSGELQPGDTYTYTFNESGAFMYKCALHPSMIGTVTVTE